MIRFASKLSRKLSEHAVLRFIAANPGKQLYEINDATLASHHSWGTKSVLTDLERAGKIDVVRFRVVRIKGELTRKKIKPLYFLADWPMRLRHDQFAGSHRIRENIAQARATGYAATSPEGLTALERAFYVRKLELEAC